MTDESKAVPMLEEASTSEDVRSLLTFARAQGPAQSDLDRLSRRLSPLVGVSVADLASPLADLGTAPANPPGFAPAAMAASKGAAIKLGLSGLGKAIVAASIVTAGAVWWAQPATPVRNANRDMSKVAAPVAPPASESTTVRAPVERAAPAPIVQPLEQAAEPKQPIARVSRPRIVEPKLAPVPVENPSEMELIRRAEGLRTQPAQAMRQLNEHARLYPDGMLAQEREVLAIEALLASGQRAQAEVRASKLAASHPGSAHLRRVRVLLGAGSAE